MCEPAWPEKLANSIERSADKEIKDRVMKGADNIDDASPKEKAAWACGAIQKLEQLVPDKNTLMEIMARCSCACFPEEKITELRSVFQESGGDIDKLLQAMYKNPFYVRPECEGNTIYFTKAPFDAEKHKAAVTEEEKRRAYCHCEYARAGERRESVTHCYCGAGWYKNMMEKILDRQVKVDVVKSVLRGDDVCRIALYL